MDWRTEFLLLAADDIRAAMNARERMDEWLLSTDDLPIRTEALAFPGLLEDFRKEIGFQATLRLAAAFGGVKLYIPMLTRYKFEDHRISNIIGYDALKRIADLAGGDILTIPAASALINRLRVMNLITAGFGTRATARVCGLTERSVRIIRSRLTREGFRGLDKESEQTRVEEIVSIASAQGKTDEEIASILLIPVRRITDFRVAHARRRGIMPPKIKRVRR